MLNMTRVRFEKSPVFDQNGQRTAPNYAVRSFARQSYPVVPHIAAAGGMLSETVG